MSDELCIGTIRCMAADVVAGANSGHPGAPMGMAPVAHVLFSKHMRFDPLDAKWPSRDRFVLSNGHACALQYIMLHLCGYKGMPMEQLKKFRQLNSVTPGHPERFPHHEGIEVTTGPLGQGIAQAVGLAIAEGHLAERFNKPKFPLFDNFTYVFCGDGCLQEGVACEATSLAGHLALGKLIIVYDDNEITIDGPTSLSYSENVQQKFEALGWHTVQVKDGDHDVAGIDKALAACKAETKKPSIILLKTTIGYGSGLQGTAKVHGAPLKPDDIKQLKAKMGLDPEAKYAVSDDVLKVYKMQADAGNKRHGEWRQMLAAYRKEYPALAEELQVFLDNGLPKGWDTGLPVSKPGEALATRKCSEIALSALVPKMTNLIGGSADLTGSNLTKTPGNTDITPSSTIGRYLRFGVREHAMAAIGNGLSCYGCGLIPFVATFFNFVTYGWGAVRVGALSNCGVIHVATHDSIGLGEDGPTHQPVEVAALCRATPNLLFFRPCDQTEVTGSYIAAIENRDKVSVLALSRQGVPMLEKTSFEGVKHGAYAVLGDPKAADLIIVSTGTEVSLAIAAAELINDLKVAVVSMPCSALYEQQTDAYKTSVFPSGVPVLAVEPYNHLGWERYCHYFMGLEGYGASAPAKDLYKHFGLTKERIAEKGRLLVKMLGKNAPCLLPIRL